MLTIVLLTIWCTGIVLIVTDRHSHSARWAGITSLVGGFGFLAGVLDDELRPLIPGVNNEIHWASNVASLVCQVGLPYAFLMFSLHSNPFVTEKTKRFTAVACILPIPFMIITTPVLPELAINYRVLAVWAITYILFAVTFLVYGFFREKDPLIRRSRLVVLIIGAMPMLFVLVTIYISRIFGRYEAWEYNAIVFLVQFLFFIGFSLKYGVLGFKLRVEENRMNSTLRALTSGTAILNHTLKNEVGKMQILLARMERWTVERPEMRQDIAELQHATEHMLDMVQRIHGKIQDIELKESVHSVEDLVQRAIRQVISTLVNKRIEFIVEYEKMTSLYVDPVHFHELLVNVLRNSVEAIPEEGIIRVRTYQSRKYFTIMVEDNGKGIATGNLPNVFDPFFSTKKNQSTNFGLGLAYCYQVARMHQGFMEMESSEGIGTLVFIYFPRIRARELQAGKGVETRATHSCNDGGG